MKTKVVGSCCKVSPSHWLAICGICLWFLIPARLPAAGLQRLEGDVPTAATDLRLKGPLTNATRLKPAIGLPVQDPTALASLLGQIYDPASTNYHHYLTPDEFTARFGPGQADGQSDNPEPLLITPAAGFTSSGGVGGPFTVTTESFTLTNTGTNRLIWSLSNTSAWLTASPSGGTLIPGGPVYPVTASLTATASTLATGSYTATLWFTNLSDNVGQSVQFSLAVISPPSITVQPTNQAVLEGATVAFTVTVTGGQPLAFEWQENGANLTDGGNISGSATTNLVIRGVTESEAGTYTVVVMNAAGTLTSSNAVLTVKQQPPCAPVSAGMVDWWTGDGTANDSVGTNNGTLVGGASYAPGEVGQAFSFDGSSGYVNIPDSPSLDSIVTNITIEAWIKVNQLTPNADWRGIVTKGESSWRLQGAPYAGTLDLYVSGLSNPELTGTRNVNDEQWHHLAAVYDGTKLYLYVDGTLDVSTPSTGLIAQDNAPVCIGNTAGAPAAYFFNGLVDAVSLYNRALSASEIQAIYAAGGKGKCPVSLAIITQPANETVNAGGTATFTVAATGMQPLSYQWSLNTTNLIGATNATLTLTAVQEDQAGNYSVLVTNAYGATNSANAVLTVNQAPPCDPPPAGLVSWWTGNGNANDSVDVNNGAWVGTAIYTNGEVGQAFFTRTNNYVEIPDSASLDQFTTAFTLEFWEKGAPSAINNWNSMVSKGDAGYEMRFEDGTPYPVFILSGVTPDALIGTININDGNWHHIAGVYNGTHMYLYVDGTLNVSQTATGTMICNSGNPLCFGIIPNATFPRWFTGQINEVAIYNAALTSNQIAAIYNAGSSGKCPLTAPVITSQPASQTVAQGGNAAFSVTATGMFLNYQWYFNATNALAWATNSVLVVTNAQLSNAGNYFVVVANPAGAVTSSNALLTVAPQPPTITTQPVSQTNLAGATVSFSVTAAGTSPLSYQWSFNAANIIGATNATLTLTNAQPNQAGDYSVLVSNAYGATNSSLAVLTLNSPPSCTPAPAGLVGWWAGDGTANDSIGTNNGRLVGGASYAPGEVGQAFSFDGLSGYVSIPDSPSLDSFVTNITIETWIKVNQLTANGNWAGIVTKGNSSWRLQGTSGAKTVTFTANPLANLKGTRDVNDGQWHHVAGVYDGTNMYLYVDGTLDVSTPAVGSMAQDSSPLYFGNTANAPAGYYFNGLVDAVSLYNCALTASEIHTIYAAGSGGKCPVPLAITTQPANEKVNAGGAATFAVAATGMQPLSYQWNFNATSLMGATNATLTLTNVQPNQAGDYAVLVSNAYGATNSAIALLTVTAPQVPVPVITSFSPLFGTTGTVVTVSGRNFSPVAASNTVYFGAVQAVVTAASATNLTVSVPVSATFAPITETVGGLTASSDLPFLPAFPGSGVFTNTSLGGQVTLNLGVGVALLVLADLDGDGKPDLALATGGQTVYVYRNISTNGTLSASSFAPPVILPLGSGTYSMLQAADLTGDGKLDLLISDYVDNEVIVLKNLSSPGSISPNSFGSPIAFPCGPGVSGLAIGDLDGDGKPEIVAAIGGNNSLSVFRNLSTPGVITTNSFAPAVTLPTGTAPRYVAIADIDGDGKPDLLTANNGGTGALSVLRNLSTPGNIAFATNVTFTGLTGSYGIAVGDLDGDGKPDVVISVQNSEAVSVFRNTSTPGSITTNSFAPRVDFATGGWANWVALGDLAGDGKLDLVVTLTMPDQLLVYQNISTPGSFTSSSLAAPIVFASGSNPNRVVIGDLDGDGRPDIAFANDYSGTMSIYQNLVPFGGPPVITLQPVSQTNDAGTTVTFSVTASGTVPLSYQWDLDGTNLAGATNAALVLADVELNQAGDYSVLITNTFGSILSSNAWLTVVASPSCDPASSGLVSWWPGDGNADDVIGGNNGTLTGGMAFTNGEVGPAFVFNGSTSYITVPASASLNIGTGTGITIECWIQPSAFNVAGQAPIVEWDSSTTDGLQFWSGGGGGWGLTADIKDTSGAIHDINATSLVLKTNQFQHVALTYDKSSGNAFIYYNGTSVVNANFGNITPQTTYPLNIGRRTGQPIGLGDNYAGLMDELSLYNRALSASEILAIYTAGQAGKCPLPPAIATQPTNQAVKLGGTASFAVLASGNLPLTCQWIFDGTNPIAGATNATLVLTNIQLSQAGTYAVSVTNLYGSLLSSNAVLTVLVPPVLTQQPASQTNLAGTTATFTVTASGTAPLSYQWDFNGTNLAGATNRILILSKVQLSQAGNYAVVVTNQYGAVLSSNAVLTVLTPPVITQQPVSQTNLAGTTATFTVTATGSQPLSYQWLFDGVPIGGSSIISTVAGKQSLGGTYSGDGGAATNAGMNYPNDIVFDGAGNLYIADVFDSVIRKVSVNGIITTVAGNHSLGGGYSGDGGAATNAALDIPNGVAVDNAGNLFIADSYNNVIRKVATDGIISTMAGNYRLGAGYSGDGGAATNAALNYPVAVAVDGAGNVYISEAGNNVIREVMANGMIRTAAGNHSLGGGYSGDGGPATNAALNVPSGVLADGAGNLFFAEVGNSVVRKVNASGIITTVAGNQHLGAGYSGDGGAATDATLNNPNELAEDSAGNLYFAEYYNNVIREVNASGTISTVAGKYSLGGGYSGDGGAATNAALNNPTGVALDGLGNMYIGDAHNNVVRKVAAAGFNVNETNGTLTITDVLGAMAGNYQVIASDAAGSVTSSVAILVVVDPVIVSQPAGLNLKVGATAAFTVGAIGSGALSYQWYWNVTNALPSATNATLSLPGVQTTNSGIYSVLVTDVYGSVLSSNAVLSVRLLDHFAWGSIPVTRFVNVPFTTTITAQNATNGMVTNFTGTVAFTSTPGVVLTPSVSGAFIQGTWTGAVMVGQTVSNLVLQATDGLGDTGLANAINIVSPPALSSVPSGSYLLMFWPTNQTGFVLETAPELNATNWMEVAAPPTPVGDVYEEFLPMSGTNSFFRLRFVGE